MKKFVFMAVILTAFVFESQAYKGYLGGAWDKPYYRTKTVSSIWQKSVFYQLIAVGNIDHDNMFCFARIRAYSSPYDPIKEVSLYSERDYPLRKEGYIAAPSGSYVYKVYLQVSAELIWVFEPPVPTKYEAFASALVDW